MKVNEQFKKYQRKMRIIGRKWKKSINFTNETKENQTCLSIKATHLKKNHF